MQPISNSFSKPPSMNISNWIKLNDDDNDNEDKIINCTEYKKRRFQRIMQNRIKLLLLRKSSRKNQLFIKNLTQMAIQIEQYLLMQVESVQEYAYIDDKTLNDRIMGLGSFIKQQRLLVKCASKQSPNKL